MLKNFTALDNLKLKLGNLEKCCDSLSQALIVIINFGKFNPGQAIWSDVLNLAYEEGETMISGVSAGSFLECSVMWWSQGGGPIST